MKSKLSLTIIYIVLIIYFKIRLPEYTCAELEHDLKITLYACYTDALIPLWKHFMYGDNYDTAFWTATSKKDDITKKKPYEEKRLLMDIEKTKSCLEHHFDSWKVQDDLRIHPIDDESGGQHSKDGSSSCSNSETTSKTRFVRF